jgi:hypothetical protein
MVHHGQVLPPRWQIDRDVVQKILLGSNRALHMHQNYVSGGLEKVAEVVVPLNSVIEVILAGRCQQ